MILEVDGQKRTVNARIGEMIRFCLDHGDEVEAIDVGELVFRFNPDKVTPSINRSYRPRRVTERDELPTLK